VERGREREREGERERGREGERRRGGREEKEKKIKELKKRKLGQVAKKRERKKRMRYLETLEVSEEWTNPQILKSAHGLNQS
jgi:hypothetical protein